MTERGPGVPLDPARLVRRIPLRPHDLTERITPQHDLFVLAHLGIPQAAGSSWRLEIGGLVQRPTTLSLEELRSLPRRSVESFHQCAGFPTRPDVPTRRVGNVVWAGVDLRMLLQQVGLRGEARFLWAFGVDHGRYEGHDVNMYAKDVPLARVERGDVLLAYEVNGEPLTAEHGYPLRLVVPGYYGTNAVKWLHRLELADRRFDGPFTTVFYNDPVQGAGADSGETRPVWEIPPESLIVSPAAGSRVTDTSIEIWGWAWAASGVSQVEISVDGGSSWGVAALEARSQWSWQRFRRRWRPQASGRHVLLSRAIDARGAVQPIQPARNTIYAVEVFVSSGSL